MIKSSNSAAGKFNLQANSLRGLERRRPKFNGDERGGAVAVLRLNFGKRGVQLSTPLVERRDRVAFGVTEFSDRPFAMVKTFKSFPPLPDELGVG